MVPEKNATVSALSGAALILAVVGAIGWMMYSSRFGWIDWLITLSGAIYFALSFVAQRWPLAAAVIGVCLYAAYLCFQVSLSFELFLSGWIIKAPVVILLLIALVSAVRGTLRRE